MNAQSQVLKSGTVLGVIQLGSIEYSIINEDNTDNIYKSAAHSIGQLHESESVYLAFSSSSITDNCEVKGSNTERIYATKVTGEQTIPSYITTIAPTLVNDILYFDDKEHLEKFEDMMANYVKEYPLIDSDTLLNQIERMFAGFTSYRTHFENKHNLGRGEFTADQILQILNEDNIKDIYLKTLFNGQKLIGIGDSVYFYAAHGQIATVAKTNNSGIQLLKNLHDIQARNRTIFDLDNHWLEIIFNKGSVYIDNEIKELRGTHYVVPEDTNGYYERYVSEPTLKSECDPLKKSIRVSVKHEIYNSSIHDVNSVILSNSSATLTINWGDGTAVQTVNNYTGENILHTYGTASSFHPITTITFNSPNGIITITDGSTGDLTFNTTISCTTADHEKSANYIGSNPNFMMTCVVWVNNGNTFNRLGGQTMGFLRNPNGTWSLGYFSIINTQIQGVFRNENCNAAQTVNGTNTKYGNNFVQEKKTKWARSRSTVGTGDVWSAHNMTFGSVLNMYHQLYINPCE